jgi:hypothetical protein
MIAALPVIAQNLLGFDWSAENLQAELENLRKRNYTCNIQLIWDEEISIMLKLKVLGRKTVFYGLNIDEQIARRQKLKGILQAFLK